MTNRDLRGELEDFIGEFPEAWKPKVGEVMVGSLLRYDSGTTSFGEHPIAVIQDERTDEARSVWLLHTVLRGEFEKKRPRPGERIGIKRLPDSEKGYKRYVVRVDREEPEIPNFQQFAPPGDVPPAERASIYDNSDASAAPPVME